MVTGRFDLFGPVEDCVWCCAGLAGLFDQSEFAAFLCNKCSRSSGRLSIA